MRWSNIDMQWYNILDLAGPELDQLAERYKLHPLHIEDCRHRGQRAKIGRWTFTFPALPIARTRS